MSTEKTDPCYEITAYEAYWLAKVESGEEFAGDIRSIRRRYSSLIELMSVSTPVLLRNTLVNVLVMTSHANEAAMIGEALAKARQMLRGRAELARLPSGLDPDLRDLDPRRS